MRLEELLRHRRSDACPQSPRERGQQHRNIQMTLMVGREHDRTVEGVEMRASLDSQMREDACEWQDPGGE